MNPSTNGAIRIVLPTMTTRPSYADKVKESLERSTNLGHASERTPGSEEAIPRSAAQVAGDKPLIFEKVSGPGAVLSEPVGGLEPGSSSEYTDLREQAYLKSGPNYEPGAEGRESATTLGETVKHKMAEGNEKAKETLTTVQQKLHDVFSGKVGSRGQGGGPSFKEKTQETAEQGNEALKDTVTRTQQKLHDVFSGQTGIGEKMAESVRHMKESLTGHESSPTQEPSIMDRLTSTIYEGSQKLTAATQNIAMGVKKSFPGGEGGEEPGMGSEEGFPQPGSEQGLRERS